MSHLVIGLDLSLTSTGVAIADPLGTFTSNVKSKSLGSTWDDRRMRILNADLAIMKNVSERADLVVIEGPSYNSKSTSDHDRAGLWWSVYRSVVARGVPVMVVAPTQVKKYATGKGNANKDAVLAAVVRRYLDIEVTGNDQADALVLAAIGRRLLGSPLEESLPLTHLEALAKLEVPEVVLA